MAVSPRMKQEAMKALSKLLEQGWKRDRALPVSALAQLFNKAGVKTISKRQLEMAVNAIRPVDRFARDLERYMAHTDEMTVEQALELLRMSAVEHLDKKWLLDAVAGNEEHEEHAEETLSHTPSERPLSEDEGHNVRPQETSSYQVRSRRTEEVPAPHTDQPHETRKEHTYQITEVAPSAIVIHCGDPRFQDAFREFVTEELGIASYVPIVIGGGINAVGIQSFLPKNFKVLYGQVKFFVKEAGIKRIIIINHQDCRWYEKMKSYRPTMDVITQGRSDLVAAAAEFVESFTDVDVETYYARLDGKTVTFEKTHD